MKPLLTITRGLPGAGKTTWARTHAATTGAVRVNRDDMRALGLTCLQVADGDF